MRGWAMLLGGITIFGVGWFTHVCGWSWQLQPHQLWTIWVMRGYRVGRCTRHDYCRSISPFSMA